MNVLLLTQNIGSVECSNDDEVTIKHQEWILNWIHSVHAFIQTEETKRNQGQMDVVVLHLQELGGKKFNKPFNTFLAGVIHKCWPEAGWCSGLLGSSLEQNDDAFTAMGTVLFLSPRMVPVSSVWSFSDQRFISVQDILDSKNTNINNNSCFYHGAKFSDAGSSRKGFLLTRLNLGGNNQPWTFMNLHLYNDADNVVAASQRFPSEYAVRRMDALLEAITRTSSVLEDTPNNPLFLFGDWNTRLDTHALKACLQQKFQETITLEKKNILASSSKVFDYFHHAANWPDLQKYFDKESAEIQMAILEKTNGSCLLTELPIRFGPTYLLVDDPPETARKDLDDVVDTSSTEQHDQDQALNVTYQQGRFPAWCDRVVYNTAASEMLVQNDDNVGTAYYWNAPLYPMDHLSVYLRFQCSDETAD